VVATPPAAAEQTTVLDVMRFSIFHIGAEATPGASIAWAGTGFLVDAACTIATATHVIADIPPEQLVVRTRVTTDRSRTATRHARVIYRAPMADVAFLRADRVNDQPCNSGNFRVFELSDGVSTRNIGAPVTIIGYPRLGGSDIDIPVVRKGHISSTEVTVATQPGPMIFLDMVNVPGFSGSPLILDRGGQVVGVVHGYVQPIAAGFGWATPITKADYEAAMATSPRE
jgi:hypothetical protein